MAASVDWASSAEEQEKLITKVSDVTVCSMVLSGPFCSSGKASENVAYNAATYFKYFRPRLSSNFFTTFP
jgi:hypothetical protein